MKRKYLLAVLPALMVLSACAGVQTQKANVVLEDTEMHSEIFGGLENAVDFRVRREGEQPEQNSVDPFVTPTIGVQFTQYEDESDHNEYYAVRYVSAISALNVKATWKRGIAKSNGDSQKAFGDVVTTKAYTSVNDNNVISYPSDKGANYNYFVVYTVRKIPLTSADSYLAAYLEISDLAEEDPHAPVYSKVIAANAAGDNDFEITSGTNGYFLQGKIGGTVKILPSTGKSGNNKADYTDVVLNAGDYYGSFYYEGSSFQFFGYDHYYDHSYAFLNRASKNGYAAPYADGGKYNLYLSGDDNNWWHVYATVVTAPRYVTLYLKVTDTIWGNAGATFAVHYWNNSDNGTTAMTAVEGKSGLYKLDNFDTQTWTGFLFYRRNPEGNQDWNQTGNCDVNIFKTNGPGVVCRITAEGNNNQIFDTAYSQL